MIDLNESNLESDYYPEFKELCNEIYRFVASNTDVTYFDLSMEYPLAEYPLFD